jgi:DNA-binding transcriptional ArsR family regulator
LRSQVTALYLQPDNCMIMETRRDVFQAIADPTRRAILGLVVLGAMTPGAIAGNFDSSRQTISKHIQILNECELLTQTQSGREIFYHLNTHKMKEIAVWLEPYRRMWEDRFEAMDDLLMEMQKTKSGDENSNS